MLLNSIGFILNVSSLPNIGICPLILRFRPSSSMTLNVSADWRSRSFTFASCLHRADRDIVSLLLGFLLCCSCLAVEVIRVKALYLKHNGFDSDRFDVYFLLLAV